MNDSERNQLETFNRVCSFGLVYAAHFPAGSLGKQLFTDLENVLTELTDQATEQSSTTRAAKQGTHARSIARAELRMALKQISRTARVIALNQPDLESKFHLPGRVNDQVLLSAARAFLIDAEPLQSQFIRHERPESFLAELSGKIVRFENAVKEQRQAVISRVSSRAAIKRAMERGIDLVERLDRVMENKYLQDEAGLAGWRKARHIVRRQRRSLRDAPAAPTPQAEPLTV